MINKPEQTEFAINLMQHLVTATFVLDTDGNVIIWNRSCERLTGITADEVIGTSNHWKAFYSNHRLCLADTIIEGRTNELDDLYTVSAQPSVYGNGYKAENWCVMPRIGKRLYLAADAGPIYDNHGQLIAVVETIRDQTDQKIAQKRLEELAVVDELTGLFNRRYFNDHLDSEWKRCAREGTPLSVILLDIDYFKQYNDNFGHLVGDECLRSVAGTIQRSLLRGSDSATRYGGEEFCVLLPGIQQKGATKIAERICANIEKLEIPHPTSPVSQWVTLSIGVACILPSENDTPANLLTLADEAMYRAKAGGRNQSFCAETD